MLSPDSRLRWLAPNLITALNIAAGFLSMLAAAEGQFESSVYLLLLAVLLDLVDGKLARRLKVTSEFGQEMDSFSDAVSFCAAPAFLAHAAILRRLGAIGVVVALVYLLAGVLRLARFNLTTDAHSKARSTTGIPTPVGAGYVMALVLMRDRIPVPMAALVVLVMACLMVSRFKLPEFRGRSPVTAALLVGVLNYFAVMLWPNWYTVGWWNVWNVVILLAARSEDRRFQEAGSSS
jgi:CDP-diacylglycerol--serine O-phosphatidyltransferase